MVATAGALTSFSFGQYLIARRAPPHVAMQAAVVQLGVGAAGVVYLARGPIGSLLIPRRWASTCSASRPRTSSGAGVPTALSLVAQILFCFSDFQVVTVDGTGRLLR